MIVFKKKNHLTASKILTDLCTCTMKTPVGGPYASEESRNYFEGSSFFRALVERKIYVVENNIICITYYTMCYIQNFILLI